MSWYEVDTADGVYIVEAENAVDAWDEASGRDEPDEETDNDGDYVVKIGSQEAQRRLMESEGGDP